MNLLLLPLVLISLFLYLFLALLGNHLWVWVVALLLATSVTIWQLKDNNIKLKIDWQFLSLVGLMLGLILGVGIVLSPFVITKNINNFEHIQITDLGDYYKHTFVTNALKQDGIPPLNPYFPSTKLSYYYGYYLIPAAVSRIFHTPPHWTFYIYSLITDFISLLIPVYIANKLLKKYWTKLLAVLLIATGMGVDTIPFIFDTAGQIQNSEGLQLISTYKSLLYVPQHFLAAGVVVWLIYALIKENLSFIKVAFFASFVFLSSVFVSLTMVVWFGLIFLSQPKSRILLVKSGLLSLILLIPYFLSLSDRGNLFSLYMFDPYDNFSTNYWLNILYTFWIKYGPLLTLMPVVCIFWLVGNPHFSKHKQNYFLLIIAYLFPLLLTWFIRSPIFNDFSMRTSIPIWLSLPVFYSFLIEESKQKLFKLGLISFAIITIFIGFKGVYWEYKKHWQTRRFLHPNESEMILRVRSLPDNIRLSAIDRNSWVELVPSLGFKKITSPNLYDSYIYFSGPAGTGDEHGWYESKAAELFLDENISKNLDDLVNQKNQQLNALKDFFNKYPTDMLLINNKLWVKKDTNPWLMIFKNLGVKEQKLTSFYTLFDYPDLLEKLSSKKILIDNTQINHSHVKDSTFFLPKGLWLLASCIETTPSYQYLEFDDYHILFNDTIYDQDRCIGKLFYLEDDEDVHVTNSTTVKSLYYLPISIEAAD